MRYKANTDVVAMGLAVRSLYLVTQYIDLPEAEVQAIARHGDPYIEDDRMIPHKELYYQCSSSSDIR
jgi:hypothetical protein